MGKMVIFLSEQEVQKFAKSGSVAQKKAYFEARYKRNASKKAADADAEAPPPTNNLPEPETSNDPYNTSSDDFDTVKLPKSCCSKSSTHMSINSVLQKDCCVKTVSSRQPQPSVACGSKSRSPTISSPFRFRSEEGVAKRKEFFQKLEENNAKEAEKMQLRTKSKEKPGTNLKKLHCSVTFKAIPTTDSSRETKSSSNHMNKGKDENELKKLRHSITFKSGSCPETDSPGNHIMKEKGNGELKKMRNSITFRPGSYNETDSPGNQIKKTPLTRWPWSPKLGRKPTPSVVQDTNSRPPRMPSARTDSSKPATEKNKLLQPKKISQENASPNIQL